MELRSMRLIKCAVLVAATLPLLALSQSTPSINVGLQTSFKAAPYLIELLETAALENSTSYFPLLDRIAEGVFLDSQTDQELYEKFTEVLQEDGHFESSEGLSSFRYALALHAAAPRIEAHYQYYRTAVESQMMAAQDAVCPVWVHLDGKQYCSPTLERAQQPVSIANSDSELPFDRSLGDAVDVPISVLYADITQPSFAQFHELVSETAKGGKSIYRLRYRPASARQRPLFVSGYGAELVLKRTDYIVIDDRDASKNNDKTNASTAKTDEASDLQPLTTTELTNLGLNTASYILSNENSFDTLVDVSANFPKFSSLIAAHSPSSDFLTEHYANRELLLPSGYNVIWMNGLQVEQRHINAYSLLDMLKRERSLIRQLKTIGLTATEAVDILSHEVLTQAVAEVEQQRYDWRDTEGKPSIMWMNNIERDKRYAGWLPGLRTLLQRSYPGQLPQVKRNLHNLILPIDIGKMEDLSLVVSTLQTIVQRLIPVRIGLIPTGNTDGAVTGIRLAYHIADTYGIASLMYFFDNLVKSKKGLSAIESTFEDLLKERQPLEGKTALSFADAIKSELVDSQIQASQKYLQRLALKDGNDLSVIVNGVVLDRDENWFDKVSQRLVADNRYLQLEVYEKRLTDDMDVAESMLAKAASRRNILIVPANPKNVTILSVADLHSEFPDSFQRLPRLPAADSTLLSERGYLFVIADLGQSASRFMLGNANKFHAKHPEVEVVIVHNSQSSTDPDPVPAELLAAADSAESFVSEDTITNLISKNPAGDKISEEVVEKGAEFWSNQKRLIARLGLRASESGLWLNGRVVGPIHTPFEVEDFEALYEYEKITRIAPVTTAITGLRLEDKFETPLDLAKVTSIVARSLISDVPEGIYESSPPVRTNQYKKWVGKHTSIHVSSKTEATIQIVAAVDPASEVTQPWIPILKTLSELGGVDIKIFLNPKDKLEDLPIKRFYRQVISAAPTFDADGAAVKPLASFTGMPKDTLFNLGMVVPPSWLVAPKESLYDLDNIKLSSVPAGQNVEATYEIEHILIEGHSRNTANNAPPRGAQLMLGTQQSPHHTDTIVMANLGYFQFKANPGYWQISLMPGRSSKLFTIDSVGAKGYAPQPGDTTNTVALLSFQGATLYPRLSRKPGMEKEDVLEAPAAGSARNYLGKGASFASSALSSIGLGKNKQQNADINIFSVASGHLYERMLNIMMVSVMRHTKHTVKFWFIEQFLSPSFKSSLPALAAHYKFDFEMVTYKWPHWLRAQKEKQREIWGYKILFLDVLFPLDLDKVIFVDADQIVRTDMMDLNNIDLGGAPYGFTPMCDSRTEMEGFRFWKQGYWKNFLEGKPYHISALYVVDLKKFRQLAAGDRLRQQYHALSADPASLSNLDQDLPNHMQHVLPVHSLPQEWLWCETWCSDESLKDARTIDLCNNPQTKEPKLDRARRQVPEWTEYDDEIAGVLRGIEGQDEQFIKDGGVQEHEQKVLSNQDKTKDKDQHKIDEL